MLGEPALAGLPRRLATQAVREVVAEARRQVLAGGPVPTVEELVREAGARVARLERPAVRRVLNATGVVLHTNLGRAPLGPEVADAVRDAALGYATVEMDMDTGGRGDRLTAVRDVLVDLTGAEDAVVVNNNAAAVLLALSTLAHGQRVAVSRGEMVEIGDSFRIPDVVEAGGATIVEVGTTNRTRLQDYERALDAGATGILRVHPSNFRIIGFTETPDREELADLAASRGVWFMEDLGSGNLSAVLPGEPTVSEVVEAGVDLVTFSGDKLLGGPQAGIVVGRRDLVRRLRKHALYRALRCDKLVLAALDATLRLHRAELVHRVPTIRLLLLGPDDLADRGAAVAEALADLDVQVTLERVDGRAGAGALPESPFPSMAVGIRGLPPGDLARRLRGTSPPLIGRIAQDAFLVDLRTLLPGEDAEAVRVLREAICHLSSGNLT